ncbi:GNAT family N-acetyltransferase [Catenulispora sp. NF23]|uniref:GNAT family N-acetyltransferase n=1 Tax=Catenulispora pinistramenti TaxID=2705254 RepID=UPI001BAB7A05|nr:GNAT family N-acetyltransferase [Catenulispora pinistramenti]MBS2535245.1 GNAT family N-acetyltransferase [Catenulispora pinistramenti]
MEVDVMTGPATTADRAGIAREPVHALLSDGTTVSIRPTAEADLDGLNAMFATLSPNSLRMRFFASGAAAGRDAARRLCEPHPDRIALVAVVHHGAAEEIVGEGEAWRLGPDADAAEVGFTVAERLRGRGIGTLLLEHLADAARAAGIRRFAAETLSENLAMKRVIASAGLHHSATFEHGGAVFHDIDLTEDDAFLEVVADREFTGSAASLTPLFRPRAVAVVGVGRTRGVGRAILEHLLAAEFDRPLFAVNPHAQEIAGVPCARSIELLPDRIDLAMLALPQDGLVEAAIACGRHGIRALTIVTSPVTEPVRTTLKAVCRRYGMRLVGPNCLGVAAFGPDITMDATFGPHTPLAGSAGVGVQSGGVGIAILDHLSRLGIGTGSFASLGDKADVSGNDLLAWWARDPATESVLLHLESFGNPRKFARYARRVARTKPVLIVAAGRSAAGSRAAASHTAASVTPGVTRDALYRQAGVIATRSVAELVETAVLLATGARPAGHRVAVVSNAGGTGVLGADACVETGLAVPEFSAALRERLSTLLGPVAACGNPVDAGAGADADLLREAVQTVASSGEVDAVLLLLVPTALAELPASLAADARTGTVPAIAVRVDQAAAVETVLGSDGRPAPVYGNAENAARALSHACDYAAWLRRPGSEVPTLSDIRSRDAARLISLFLAAHPEGGWLPPDRAADLLACYGIGCPRLVLATDEQTAVTAAALWGTPVAMKAYWPELVHKSDMGGVLLGLSGPEDIRAGWRRLHDKFGDRLAGVIVQEMAPVGVELLAGVDNDAVFGPLVAFGIGGTGTDLAADRAFRLAPLTGADAGELVRSTRAARLLAGYRGRPGGDVAVVREVLSRLALLAAEQTCVAEAEINPLIAAPDGVTAADFRIRVEPRTPTDPYLRRLR